MSGVVLVGVESELESSMLPLGLSLAAATGEVTTEEQREAVELALPVLFWRLDSEQVRRSP